MKQQQGLFSLRSVYLALLVMTGAILRTSSFRFSIHSPRSMSSPHRLQHNKATRSKMGTEHFVLHVLHHSRAAITLNSDRFTRRGVTLETPSAPSPFLSLLIDLGRRRGELPAVPDELKPKLERVQECASDIRVFAECGSSSGLLEGRVRVHAEADSMIARGMVTLVGSAIVGRTAASVLEDSEEIILRRAVTETLAAYRSSKEYHHLKELDENDRRIELSSAQRTGALSLIKVSSTLYTQMYLCQI
jgi:sulfur transfer protein SufE